MTRVLFVSHTYPSGVFRVGSHHLSRELAVQGHEVLHVSTSFSLVHQLLRRVDASQMTAYRSNANGSRSGVIDLIPRTVLPVRYLRQARWGSVLGNVGWKRADVTFVDEPMMWSRTLRDVSGTLVYRPTDLYLEGVKERRQRQILRHVDGVVATSRTVLEGLGPLEIPSMVMENGVEHASFASADGPRRRSATYVGALDGRFDWNAIEILSRGFPEWTFSIVGPGSPPRPFPNNVEILGPVPYPQIPLELSRSRIGLLPLSSDPLNAGRSPMKLYEYLSAGLVVVSRQTSQLAPNADVGIFTYDSDTSLLSAFAAAAGAANAAANLAGVAHAASQDWSRKAQELLRFARSLRPRQP
ncbi:MULTISPECIES: glycosyltransferase family protein [Microbacterium]|uniref:glycosyltransferase family protein n=1 Tax=Microbacterium TaxID=33882 RepID=UPI0010F4FE97|nr:glycosyltransferase [Microbacterium sp. 4NA327F11]MCK9919822.1 glycosyltransferase [Microbacteriaceae bacterium K1510]